MSALAGSPNTCAGFRMCQHNRCARQPEHMALAYFTAAEPATNTLTGNPHLTNQRILAMRQACAVSFSAWTAMGGACGCWTSGIASTAAMKPERSLASGTLHTWSSLSRPPADSLVMDRAHRWWQAVARSGPLSARSVWRSTGPACVCALIPRSPDTIQQGEACHACSSRRACQSRARLYSLTLTLTLERACTPRRRTRGGRRMAGGRPAGNRPETPPGRWPARAGRMSPTRARHTAPRR